jgi:ribosome-binding factor A
MKRNALLPAILAVLLSSSAIFAAEMMVKDIDVEVDLTEVTNPTAAARYKNIGDDLTNALAARLTDRISDDGVRLLIDISEVELSNSFQDELGLADSLLVGDIKIMDESDNSNFDSYKLSVDMNQAKVFVPEGVDMTVLTASSDDYYAAMIAAFADGVVARLKD